MTNLDRVLKSRNITDKVMFVCLFSLVKAMVFPVVMCGCESWTIKKAEHQLSLNCGVGEDSSPLDCKGIKLVNPKGNQF